MDKELFITLMEISMRDNLNKIKDMELELWFFLIEINILGNGQMIKLKEKEK